MIKLTEEQISDIAQDLEAGLKCFIHKVTGEVKTLPDELIQWRINRLQQD